MIKDMLVRIVRMQFQPDKTGDFLKLFKNTYTQIRSFEGCSFLELYSDQNMPDIFYTISKWDNEEKLAAYRSSGLFNETWAITKSYFAGPPVAYSLNKVVNDSTNPF